MSDARPLHKEKLTLKSPTLLDIDCPNCGSPIHPKDININRSMGKCGSCDNIFAFDKDDFFLMDRPGRPEMIMPEGTDVLTLSDSLDIRVDWSKSQPKGGLLFLTFFTLMWNGIVGVIATNMILSSSFGALLTLSLHFAAGIFLLYWVASYFFNKTDIIVTEQNITISKGPLKNPFNRDVVINSADVEQLYVVKYVRSTTNGVPNYAYALYAIKTDGSKTQLIKGMNKETQLYLEQEIERYLRIKDHPISGGIQ